MRLNQLVLKRFEELTRKGNAIQITTYQQTYSSNYLTDETRSRSVRKIDRPAFFEWSTSALNLLHQVFGGSSVYYTRFLDSLDAFEDDVNAVFDCRAIFKAAREDYQGGYLFNMQALASAEVLEDVLDQAKALLNAGYKDPACVMAGVALEGTLKKICDREEVDRGTLERMNADLTKKGLYNGAMQKQISAWAARRNDAAHGNHDTYSPSDVNDMITGVQRFIAEHL